MKMPSAPYSAEYCRNAARAASALAVGAEQAAAKKYWRSVEERWLKREEEALARKEAEDDAAYFQRKAEEALQ